MRNVTKKVYGWDVKELFDRVPPTSKLDCKIREAVLSRDLSRKLADHYSRMESEAA